MYKYNVSRKSMYRIIAASVLSLVLLPGFVFMTEAAGKKPTPTPTPLPTNTPTPTPTPIPNPGDCTKYVSTTGSDTNDGSATGPWRNVLESVNKLTPGDVLCILPGTYTQEVTDASLPDGNASARITVKSYDPSDRALLDGSFRLSNLSFWTIRDLRFTNPTPTATDNINARIVYFGGGNDSQFGPNNEVFNGTYAGLLIGRATATSEIPHRWLVTGNYVHDTSAAGLYFNPSRYTTGNVIERNLFVNNGTENAKLGWGGNDLCNGDNWEAFGIGGTEFRYNTLHDGGRAGHLIIAEPGGLSDVIVHHNLITDPASERGHMVRYDSVEGCLGDRVYVTDSYAWGGTVFSEDFDDSAVNVSHEANNIYFQGTNLAGDPQYDANYVPQNPAAQGYGHAAP